MENENKEIFDYDEYVKSGGKKNKTKKNSQRKSSSAKPKNDANQDNPSEIKKPEQPKQEKPTEAKKNEQPKQEKQAEVKKTEQPKQEKPAEVKKTEPTKQEKTEEDNKAALKNAGKKLHSAAKKSKTREDSIDSIKKMLDGALDEDSEDMAELLTEEAAPEMPAAITVDRSRMYFLLGLLIAFFSVIGIISTVFFSVEKIQEFTDNTQQKNDFARFIYPVVICDPPLFNETMRMNNDTILSAAMWDIILYDDKTKYEQDFDYITVPEVDVEKHAVKLFGEGLSFTHKSILSSEVKFHYEEDIKSYRIPAKPRYFTYSPFVEEIEREGDVYVLTVGYISPTPAYFDLNDNGETPTPDKYVEYVVKKQGDEYTLTAINASEKGRDLYLGL